MGKDKSERKQDVDVNVSKNKAADTLPSVSESQVKEEEKVKKAHEIHTFTFDVKDGKVNAEADVSYSVKLGDVQFQVRSKFVYKDAELREVLLQSLIKQPLLIIKQGRATTAFRNGKLSAKEALEMLKGKTFVWGETERVPATMDKGKILDKLGAEGLAELLKMAKEKGML